MTNMRSFRAIASIDAFGACGIERKVWLAMKPHGLYLYDGKQLVSAGSAPNRERAQSLMLTVAQLSGDIDKARFGHVELWWHSGYEPWRLSLQGELAWWQIGEVSSNA